MVSTFFAELKRRNVLRAGALYIGVAWALAQGLAQLFPAFGVPDWAVRWFVFAAIIGFPFWLAFAWFYAWTPEGLKRESEVDPARSLAGRTGKRLDRWIIAVLALAVVLLLTRQFATHDDGRRETGVPAKSIAVLPFENLSADPANAYFASGMQDEILTRLAGIRDLRVISRSSTTSYRSHPDDLPAIGQQLGVAMLLEGSVQKAGEAVHVNVQLIDVQSAAHLWAESYDRDLKDVFGVERDVAENVASALQARLLPAEAARLAAIPTHDPRAYDLYLRAGYHANRAFDQDALVLSEMPRALVLYQEALAQDPEFALASSALAIAHLFLYWYAADHAAEHLPAARSAAERALALQPELGEAHLAMGLYHYWGHRDYARALQQIALARQALPNSADVELYLAAIARRQGRWDDALAAFRRASVLAPRSAQYPGQLGQTYQVLRRYAQADRVFAGVVRLSQDPLDEEVRHAMNTVFWNGDLAPLRAALGALNPGDDGYAGNAINFYRLEWWSRDYAAAARTAATSTRIDWIDRSNVALPARLHLAWAHEALGHYAQAAALYAAVGEQAQSALAAHPDDPNLHLALAFADAGRGLTLAAAREGRKVAELIPVDKDALSGPDYLVFLAQLDVRLGDHAAALERLGRLFAIPAGHVLSPALLRLDPLWDPLRNDPRFPALISSGEAAVRAAAAR